MNPRENTRDIERRAAEAVKKAEEQVKKAEAAREKLDEAESGPESLRGAKKMHSPDNNEQIGLA